MSVLTFLCFTSLLYFSLADPVPTKAGTSPVSAEYMQKQVDLFTADVQKCLDDRLSFMFDNFEPDDKKYIEDMFTKAVEGYANYMEMLISQRLTYLNDWADGFDSEK